LRKSVCLNELGRALCYYTIPAVSLLPLTKEQRLRTLTEIRTLEENLDRLFIPTAAVVGLGPK
jgi:hypothetical protein